MRKWRGLTESRADCSHFPFAALSTTWFSQVVVFQTFLKFKHIVLVLTNIFELHSKRVKNELIGQIRALGIT